MTLFLGGYLLYVDILNRPTKYETLCLIEPQRIITYRGITAQPKMLQDPAHQSGTLWQIQEYTGDTLGKLQAVTGDCFYHPAK